MKKQLLIAAVAATMTSVAFADISISGAAQVNYTNVDLEGASSTNAISHDFDLKVTGKSGATTIVMDIENTDANANAATTTVAAVTTFTGAAATTVLKTANELNVKNAYMMTSIAGVNIKAGTWYGGDSLLGNGTQGEDQLSLDTTISGVKVQYETSGTNLNTSSVTLSGAVSGVALSHEIHDAKTDT
jgi:mRNA-degrading endonuclease toxin of MazEF toxin-antitoxin module